MQAANRVFCELESFRNPQTFDPKDLFLGGNSDYQEVPTVARHLRIGKKILQLNGLRHANRLEAVPRTPMAQDNARTNLFTIKDLSLPAWFEMSTFFQAQPPEDAYSVKGNVSRIGYEIDLVVVFVKIGGAESAQHYFTLIASKNALWRGRALFIGCDRGIWPGSQLLHEFEISGETDLS